MTDEPKRKFYVMRRDTMYHITGDIIQLFPDQVMPYLHDEVTFPAENHGEVEALQATVDRLEEAMRLMRFRLDKLESPEMNEAVPASPVEPAPSA